MPSSGSCSTQLEANRSLACDDELIFVRMDERPARLVDVRARGDQGVLEELPAHLRVGTVVAAGLDLRHRRRVRHEDARVNSELARRPRNSLTVIAGAGRDDARLALLGRQRGELVDGAAHLEGTRSLQVLGLEAHFAATAARERLREVDRRLLGDPLQAPARLLDVSECRCDP